jgi:hypothetical protein
MLYQLPNGKVINITIEEYLEITDLDIQYLMSLDFGEHIVDPFTGSAVEHNRKEKSYDFEFVPIDEEENYYISDDEPFDDIIDLTDNLDM